MRRSTKKIDWQKAPDIKRQILHLVRQTEIDWLKSTSIFCVRSHYAHTRAYARIWGLGRIWQEVLDLKPSYIIEVISEHFDNLSQTEKDRVLLHEINHIPRNFSGALVPHTRRGKRSFRDRLKVLYEDYHSSRR